MATDFFQRQASARRSTAWLIGMFLIAVIGIVGATFIVALMAVEAQRSTSDSLQAAGPFPWQVPIGAGAASLGLIGLGTLYKVAALRAGGGTGVAESLGGKRLYPGAVNPDERKLLNVVEEMAIASGVPVPPVFLMEEEGINAFAAGYSPSDAVIGVTRGCVNQLSRDELQGVIAHEFSHILNGDMRMSIRLIGILHGILLLGLIGQILFRLVFYSGAHVDSRRNDSDSGKGGAIILVVLAVAVALIIIGSIGSLIGGLIKAAVSRQREYLADASAVQFTRNPEGISGALKRIAATLASSRLRHPRAAEMSHMYFAQGVWEGFTSLMATHPPLNKRILAIEPNWDGTLPEPLAVDTVLARSSSGRAAAFAGADVGDMAVPLEVVANAVDQVGEPEEQHRKYARKLLQSLPEELVQAARDPYGSRALLYGMLLDKDCTVRQKQFDELREIADPGAVKLMLKLLPMIDQLESEHRLPLVDMTLPALGALSSPQYQRFARSFRELVLADDHLSLFEWVLSQVLMRHLRPKFEQVRSPRIEYYALGQLGPECSVVLSALAHSGADAEQAFQAAARELPELELNMLSKSDCNLKRLREALATLTTVTAKHRGSVIEAASAAICADGKVDPEEVELLRGISDLLDCPMPPLLPGQTV